MKRFGTARSLGEVYATSYALKAMREGSTLSIVELAEATGCSKQNLSRWLQHQVDTGQAKTKPADHDARKVDITLTDPMWSYRHLEALASILNCNLDQPQKK